MREIYRILDANFNRAREALRVIEDFARFALDDAGLSASAKGLRARLRRARERFPAGELLAARDTPGDVGTRITTAEEKDRPDAAAVVSAACKRLGEALRTLEEYAKVVSAEDASAFEEMRYSAYALEQRLGARLAVGRRFEDVRLYVLLTSRLCRRDPLLVARAVLAGGADWRELVRRTSVPRLSVLPAGQLPADDGSPRTGWKLASVLDALRNRYRLVLIDAPSLAHPEVAPWSRLCDGTYLVVDLGQTGRRAARQAVRLIEKCGGRVLGCVLVNAPAEGSRSVTPLLSAVVK